jgi:predicted AlkP superfamily pyrophosphatase or phosphodiesterase
VPHPCSIRTAPTSWDAKVAVRFLGRKILTGVLLLLSLVLTWRLDGAQPMAQHVVVIGCDGFGSLGFTGSNAPVLHKMMREGAYTLRARAVMPTSSSPNWASMIMGAGPEQHGITSNDWQPNKFDIAPVVVGRGGIFPTIYGIIREQKSNAYIACIHDWEGYGRLVEPKVPDLLEHVKGSALTAARAIEVIHQKKPTFLFIHFDDVDHAGHQFGWKSSEYFQAIEEVDGLIGKVLDALDASGMRKETIVIMTADHGGVGTKHGGATMVEIEIPLILHGPGIVSGLEIKTPVNTFDLAPTIARIFNLKPPGCWIGRPVLEALKQQP